MSRFAQADTLRSALESKRQELEEKRAVLQPQHDAIKVCVPGCVCVCGLFSAFEQPWKDEA